MRCVLGRTEPAKHGYGEGGPLALYLARRDVEPWLVSGTKPLTLLVSIEQPEHEQTNYTLIHITSPTITIDGRWRGHRFHNVRVKFKKDRNVWVVYLKQRLVKSVPNPVPVGPGWQGIVSGGVLTLQKTTLTRIKRTETKSPLILPGDDDWSD